MSVKMTTNNQDNDAYSMITSLLDRFTSLPAITDHQTNQESTSMKAPRDDCKNNRLFSLKLFFEKG